MHVQVVQCVGGVRGVEGADLRSRRYAGHGAEKEVAEEGSGWSVPGVLLGHLLHRKN